MENKGINTAEMNFLNTRRRVQKKNGVKEAEKVPPTTTLATPRGGPRLGPGRETGKVLPTTTPATPRDGPRPRPGQGMMDTVPPRPGFGRERASGPWREPAPRPHGAPRHKHLGV